MAESQKESFRKYLEQAGVIDSLVKVLVSLYEEPDKPKHAIDFMKTVLGGPTPKEYDEVLAERDDLRSQLEEAKQTITELEARVATLESAQ